MINKKIINKIAYINKYNKILIILIILVAGVISAYKSGLLDSIIESIKSYKPEQELKNQHDVSNPQDTETGAKSNDYENMQKDKDFSGSVFEENVEIMKMPRIYVYKYGETIEAKPGDEITYSGRTGVSFVFDSKIDEQEIRKSIKLYPFFEPDQIYVGENEQNNTILYFNLVDTGDNKKPDYYTINVLHGLKDYEGKVLNEDLKLSFIKKEHPVAEICLTDGKNGTKLPYSVYVSDEEKTFIIKFSKDVNKQSAESMIKQNIFGPYSIDGQNYANMPILEFEWKSARILKLRVKSLMPDKWYQVCVTGTEDFEGCKIMESEYYLDKIEKSDTIYDVYIFNTGSKQHIWNQNIVTGDINMIASVPHNRYYCGRLSADGNWISLGRFTNLEGDLYFHTPVFLNVKSQQYVYMSNVHSFEDIKWYNTKASALLNNGTRFNIQDDETSVVLRNKNNHIVGIMPSPDDNLIAAFTRDFDMGKITLNIVSAQNFDSTDGYDANIIKSIPVTFFNKKDADGIYLRPLTFDWIDQNTIITEGWEKNNINSHIYKIDIRSGNVVRILKDAMRPVISTDRREMAVIRLNSNASNNYTYPKGIEFFGTDGKPLNGGNNVISEKYLGAEFSTDMNMMWTDNSDKFYIFNTWNIFNNKQKYIISYDVYSGGINKIEVPENTNYTVAGITKDGQEIICTNIEPLPRN